MWFNGFPGRMSGGLVGVRGWLVSSCGLCYNHGEVIEMKITKSSDKVLCYIYRIFLTRKKAGQPRREASRFSEDFYKSDEDLSRWHESDIDDALMELGRSGLLRIYIGGDFDLTDDAIIAMENRFKDGFKELAAFISQFVP